MDLCQIKWEKIGEVTEEVFIFIENHMGQHDMGAGFCFSIDELEYYKEQAKGNKKILNAIETLRKLAEKNDGFIEVNTP